jgi:hypothetical protein
MSFLSFIKISEIFFLFILLFSSTTFSKTLSKNSLNYCTNACSSFQASKSNTNHCTSDPQASSSTLTQCFMKAATQSRSLDSHCAALDLITKSMPYEIATVALYSTASASCLTACGFLLTGIFAEFALPMEVACATINAGALATDLTNMIKIQEEGKKDRMAVMGSSTLAGTAEGLTLLAIASQFSGASTSLMSDTSFAKGFPCVAGAFLLGLSIMKGKSLSTMQKHETEECNSIKNLYSSMNQDEQGGSQGGNLIFGNGEGYASLPPSQTTSNAGGTNINLLQASSPENALSNQGELSNVLQSTAALATNNSATAPFSTMLKELANTQKIPLETISNSLKNGENTLKALFSGYPKIPEDVQNAMKKIENLANKGEFSLVGFSATGTYTNAGTTKPKNNTLTPTIQFETHPSEVKTLAFQGASLPIVEVPNSTEISDPDTTDIWHSNESETIFKIISRRLRLCQEYLETLFWQNIYNKKK